MELEYRTVAEARADGRVLYGIACPYGRPADIGPFRETIAPLAFSRVLRERQDVMLLRDHRPDQLLARVSNGSLVLEDAPDGLHFRATLAQFSAADDVLAMARANLLAGCSIGFHARGQQWNAARDQRTLTDIELVEISAVQSAVAYDGTTIAARQRQNGLLTDGKTIARLRMLAVL